MSIDDTDVLARLRAGADQVERHEFDANHVLVGSRRALRHRRSWQAAGGCVTAAVVAFSLALAGPVPVPGVGDVTLPGSEQVRELFGLETGTPVCAVEDDLTLNWGDVKSRTMLVLTAGHVIDDGAAGESATFEDGTLPSGKVSTSDLLVPDVARALPARAAAEQHFDFFPEIDDGYDRLANMDTQDYPDGTYVLWTASELRSLHGVVRCGGLPITLGGGTSADFTITSWNGTDSNGILDCAEPPGRPTKMEREALEYCGYLE